MSLTSHQRIIRNRWHVAYTLLKNRDLIKLRKSKFRSGAAKSTADNPEQTLSDSL